MQICIVFIHLFLLSFRYYSESVDQGEEIIHKVKRTGRKSRKKEKPKGIMTRFRLKFRFSV